MLYMLYSICGGYFILGFYRVIIFNPFSTYGHSDATLTDIYSHFLSVANTAVKWRLVKFNDFGCDSSGEYNHGIVFFFSLSTSFLSSLSVASHIQLLSLGECYIILAFGFWEIAGLQLWCALLFIVYGQDARENDI